MPNGGITPDCIHCKMFEGRSYSDDDWYCHHHQMQLAYPIRAFCSNYVNRELTNDVDWLDQELERDDLNEHMMYLWLGGHGKRFFHVLLTSIEDYQGWSREKFLQELTALGDKYNKD